jgi:hypothetical protein
VAAAVAVNMNCRRVDAIDLGIPVDARVRFTCAYICSSEKKDLEFHRLDHTSLRLAYLFFDHLVGERKEADGKDDADRS